MVEESDIKYDEVSNTDTLYSSTDTVYFLKTILSPRIGLIDSVIWKSERWLIVFMKPAVAHICTLNTMYICKVHIILSECV